MQNKSSVFFLYVDRDSGSLLSLTWSPVFSLPANIFGRLHSSLYSLIPDVHKKWNILDSKNVVSICLRRMYVLVLENVWLD